MSMDETSIKRHVIAAFPGDDLQEDEIILKADGEIVIDRRKKSSWAEPVVVGRWRS